MHFKQFLLLGMLTLSFISFSYGADEDKTSLKCSELVDGSFPIPTDGRVITPCEAAYSACSYAALLQVALKKLSNTPNPSSKIKKEITLFESELPKALKERDNKLLECSFFSQFFIDNPTATEDIDIQLRKD